jgi:very-short-patch-repair endonuclease
MGTTKNQARSGQLWRLSRRQHGVVGRSQLLDLGFSPNAIAHRLQVGRLHPLWRGVYAVGRPDVSRRGRLMAAILKCGPAALVSHGSAASLWGLSPWREGIDVVVPYHAPRHPRGIRVHRRLDLTEEHKRWIDRLPVTDPISTLVDVTCSSSDAMLAQIVREADRLALVDPVSLRVALDTCARRPGVGRLRSLLDCETFSLTDSELERRFLRLVRAAGLAMPETQVWLNGFRVDFYWPELGLVVETDGLRYHRTASQQRTDRVRDQAHTVAGLTHLRFTAAQVRYEPQRTMKTLASIVSRLHSLPHR